jgi:hypothetical protein
MDCLYMCHSWENQKYINSSDRKQEGKKLLGRSNHKWENNMKTNVSRIRFRDITSVLEQDANCRLRTCS